MEQMIKEDENKKRLKESIQQSKEGKARVISSAELDALSYTPNEETVESIEASERGDGIKKFESVDDLFEDLGI